MRKLLILGAGGHGKVVGEIAQLMKQWDEICYLDDHKEACLSFPVIGGLSDVWNYAATHACFVAIGDNGIRSLWMRQLVQADAAIPILIHPSAVVSEYAQIGRGSVCMAGAVINPGVVIKQGCIVNTGASIDHDCELEEYVHISPGAHLSGNVHVKALAWIGTGSCVRNQITIGTDAICGVGSVIVKDVEDGVTVIGNPARRLRG